jgi:signal peptidase I
MDSKEGKGKIRKALNKIWFLLWKDNSFKGWVLSLIILFVFIKFIFFPFMNLITGTSLPLAIVESCSMYHNGNVFSDFNTWFNEHQQKYENLNLTKKEFQTFVLNKGFDKGDILFLVKANPKKLKIGDIIAFSSGTSGTPIIHRIISIREENGEKIFSTIGDNNAEQLNPGNNYAGIDERDIKANQLVGKSVFRLVPKIGWVKLIFFEALRSQSERGFCKSN